MKSNLTVVIPTLNNSNGLEYLKNYFKDKPFKVVVVDNSRKNLGFAGGVNKGAKNVKTKWILILNDDIKFENDKALLRLIEVAESKKLDAVSPILRNPDGKVENYGYKVLLYGKIELIKNPNDKIQMTNQIQNSKSKIDGLTAACLLVKTSVFKKLKGFDEKFFAYLEDVDFFLRMKKDFSTSLRFPFRVNARNDNVSSRAQSRDLNFGIAYDIEVLHNHMTTAKTMGNFKAKQDMVNWWRLYFKHKDMFKFNWKFIVERLRNISGYIKATFKISNF